MPFDKDECLQYQSADGLEIGIIYNPNAGGRKAASYAEALSVYFTARGAKPRVRQSSRKYNDDEIKGLFSSLHALIVVGGDGTIRPLLPLISEMNVPVLLFPAGNESLIARYFNVNRSIPDIYDRVLRRRVENHYFCEVNHEPFFLMLSAGLDAEIVRQVNSIRTVGSSAYLYARAALMSLFSYREAEGEVRFDDIDNQISSAFCGGFVLANAPPYARSFMPVSEASSQGNHLSVRLFNERKFNSIFNWGYAYLFKQGLNLENSQIFYCSKARIVFKSPAPVQLDGDYLGEMTELSISKSEKQVPFLV